MQIKTSCCYKSIILNRAMDVLFCIRNLQFSKAYFENLSFSSEYWISAMNLESD